MSEKQEPTKLSELKRGSPLFSARLGAEDYPVGDVVFELQGLPGSVDTFINSNMVRNRKTGEAVLLYCRFGIAGIRGLCDEAGYKVTPEFSLMSIMGRDFKVLSWKTIDGLREPDGAGAPGLLSELMVRIVDLTRLGSGEKQQTDFTSATSPGSSDARAVATAPVEEK